MFRDQYGSEDGEDQHTCTKIIKIKINEIMNLKTIEIWGQIHTNKII